MNSNKTFSNFDALPVAWQALTDNLRKAEYYAISDPAHSALLARKALEEWVRWMFTNDEDLVDIKIYDDSLANLMHHQTFKDIIAPKFFAPLNIVRKLGNDAAHTNKKIQSIEAIHSLKIMHEFVYWVANIYQLDGKHVPKPEFVDKFTSPLEEITLTKKQLVAIEEQFLAQQQELEQVRSELARSKQNKVVDYESLPAPLDPNEALTRSLRIDLLLNEAGWDTSAPNVCEFLIKNCRDVAKENKGDGYADYVLWGDDGLPLAVVEAKRTKLDAELGREQAREYAEGLLRDYKRLPIVFYTNGFETYLWDIGNYAPRQVYGFYTKAELQTLVTKRNNKTSLATTKIDEAIVNRDYQIEAIVKVSEAFEQKRQRGALLVMATGTGKTRISAALIDILSRASWAKRVLFLADRTALVKQAKDSLTQLLPNLPTVNLITDKEDNSARIIFSTYQTLNNLIDGEYDGKHRFYGVGHFDLIIFDEIHRSVYNKYRAIFNYFDGLKLGLTATPRSEADRDTYELFGLAKGDPTDAYELEQAVADKWLVPPKDLDVPIKFPREGIKYNELSLEDKLSYEEKFTDPETGEIPDEINNTALNDWLFNDNTVDKSLNVLMEHGIKIENGDKLAKTIIFATSHKHAKFIVDRFDRQYPEYKGEFLRLIDYQEPAKDKLLEDFKDSNKYPQIAVSVDMLDTGIDIPEVANLVFFKRVYSYSKYWQMIGRGTRLCHNLFGDGKHKAEFVILDLCGNFEFFKHNPQGFISNASKKLSQRLFELRVNLARLLQKSNDNENIEFANQLKQSLLAQVQMLNQNNFEVRQNLRMVDQYSKPDVWDELTENKQLELNNSVAHLISIVDEDETAKLFDARVLKLQLAIFEVSSNLPRQIESMQNIARRLSTKTSIPMINTKITVLQQIQTKEFWSKASILAVEKIRTDIRALMKFLIDDDAGRQIVYSRLNDELGEITEKAILQASRLDIDSYRRKIVHYLEEHKNHITIFKLRTNQQITTDELKELEDMLIEQGDIDSSELLSQVYDEKKSLGRFIRSIMGLDRNAVSLVFAKYLNNSNYNSRQIDFINAIITSFTQNGIVEPAMLFNPPFIEMDSQSIFGVFNGDEPSNIISLMEEINQNADVA